MVPAPWLDIACLRPDHMTPRSPLRVRVPHFAANSTPKIPEEFVEKSIAVEHQYLNGYGRWCLTKKCYIRTFSKLYC